MNPDLDLSGKVIIITGSGRGIGAACAKAIAALEARVILNDADAAAAAAVADELSSAGASAIAHGCDISDFTKAGELIERAIAEYGKIDGLVNNAGILRFSWIEEMSQELVQDTLAVNVAGTASFAHHAAKHMIKKRSGAIVNVTSGAQMGMEANATYGATKGAVASLNYAWALELSSFGIRVNAISPMANSRMWSAEGEYRQARGQSAPATPQGPPAESNAPVVCFLLSDRARDANGQTLRMNGGELSLMAHTVIALPVIAREHWTASEVADAFDRDFRHRQCPLGVVSGSVSYSVDP